MLCYVKIIFKVEVAVYGPREIPKRSDFSMKGNDYCPVLHESHFVIGTCGARNRYEWKTCFFFLLRGSVEGNYS